MPYPKRLLQGILEAAHKVQAPEPRKDTMTNRQIIIDAIRELPGIGSGDVAKLTGISPGSVSSHMSQLATEGALRREPEGRGYAYFVAEQSDKPAPVEPAEPKPKRSKSSKLLRAESALEAALEHIKNLEAWQEAAIQRHPDLGVRPEVLAARQVAMNYYHRRADPKMVSEIKAGKHDDAPFMHMILAAMS